MVCEMWTVSERNKSVSYTFDILGQNRIKIDSKLSADLFIRVLTECDFSLF